MNDERLGRATGEWLRDIEAPPPDPDAGVQRAMTEVARTGQTRARWPLSSLRRRGRASSEPTTFNGRTRSMLSPLTAITAGALVLAAGGALLVAQNDQGNTTAPGAAAPIQEPSAFEGRIQYARTLRGTSDTNIRDGLTEGLDGAWVYRIVEMSDPRFSGDVTVAGNVHTFEGSDAEIWSSDLRFENEDGAWQKEPSLVMQLDPVTGSTSTILLVGEGAYDGLVAVTEMVYDLTDPNGVVFDLRGFVMDVDDLPPALAPRDSAP